MKHRLALIFGLTALTALLFAADLTAGSSGMPLSAVLNALWAGPSGQSPEALILWSLRLPMTLTALFVGAALALAGLQIQTITANALAEPFYPRHHLGSELWRSARDHRRFYGRGELWLGTMAASFLASLLICALILALGRLRGMTPTTLILAGIVMNFFFMALHQFLVYVASPEVAQLISGGPSAILSVLAGFRRPAPWAQFFSAPSFSRRKSGRSQRFLSAKNVPKASAFKSAACGFSFFNGIRADRCVGELHRHDCLCGGLVAPHCAKLLLGDDQRFLMPASMLFRRSDSSAFFAPFQIHLNWCHASSRHHHVDCRRAFPLRSAP